MKKFVLAVLVLGLLIGLGPAYRSARASCLIQALAGGARDCIVEGN